MAKIFPRKYANHWVGISKFFKAGLACFYPFIKAPLPKKDNKEKEDAEVIIN